MKLSRLTVAIEHKIWQPRWHDKVVLIAARDVSHHNIIEFTKIPEGNSWSGKWYVSGKTVQLYEPEPMPTKAGGTIMLHPVPLDELVLYEGRE